MASKHFPRFISRYPTNLFQVGYFIHHPPYVPICIFFVSLLMFWNFPPPNPASLYLSVQAQSNHHLLHNTFWLAPFGTSHFLHSLNLWTSPVLSVLLFGTHQKLCLIYLSLICGRFYPWLDSRFLVSRKW